MKQVAAILIAVLVLSSLSLANEVVQLQPIQDDVIVNVLESSDSRILARFDIGSFSKEAIVIDGKTYYHIRCGEEGVLRNAGEPSLPHVNRSIIIPDDAEMAVKIVSSEYRDFPNTPVAPSKGTLPRTVNPNDIPYKFGDIYNSDQWSADRLVDLRDPFILRDFRGTVIELFPFSYNFSSKTLRVYSTVTVEVTPAGPGVTNVLERNEPFTSVVPDFDLIYKQRFINYGVGATLYDPVQESGEMLIITYDSFNSAMTPFVEWKNQKGIPTTIVNVSTIGNNASSIKNYIQGVYNSSDLAWVLLVGDYTQVRPPTVGWWGDPADPTYAQLAGGDSYPDIFVGRFSAENTSHVSTQVERTVYYERDISSGSWLDKGCGVASDQGPGHYNEYDDDHMDYIRNDLLGYTYSAVDQIYDPYASASQVTNALNSGRTIVNYCGHGSTTSWSTTGFSNSHINNLTNVNKLPFIISVACVNGNFDGNTCFAEAWLRATSGGQPTGALATYMSSINQYWDEPMYAQDEATDLLVADQMHTFGGICFNGSCHMIDVTGSWGVDMYETWHIFGDPSVLLRTDTPQSLSVNHAGTIPVGQTYYDVEVAGVGRALCALYADGTLYGSAYTDGNGQVAIPVTGPLPNGATLSLTVTAFNKITYIDEVVVGEGGPCADIYMVPDDEPIYVPPGGSFGFTGFLGNPGADPITVDVWGGVIYNDDFYQLWIFRNQYLNSGQYVNAHMNQDVPGYANPGLYQYVAYCGDHPTACASDMFEFNVTSKGRHDENGEWKLRGGWDTASENPEEYSLISNYPNPFNASTTITYTLPEAAQVTLDVYNILGQKVSSLVDGYMDAGEHNVVWDAANYSSGAYFYKLTVGEKTFTKRMVLLK